MAVPLFRFCDRLNFVGNGLERQLSFLFFFVDPGQFREHFSASMANTNIST